MPKRVLTGTVVSDKAEKTVVVRVERRVKHPLYGKIIKLSKKYHAHDEPNAFKAGEQVRIEECSPISKQKSWKVVDRIGAAKAAVVEIDETQAATPPKSAAKAKTAESKATESKATKSKAKAEDVADAEA